MSPRDLLTDLFRTAIASADPAVVLARHLPERPPGRTVVVGAGKAAASMARAVERAWDGPVTGLVVTSYGHDLPDVPGDRRIEVVQARHPVPDAAGEAAARRILSLVGGLGPDDLVLCLISGGGSSILLQPGEGLKLADKQAVNAELLRSGAPIGEMNVVRRHLSAIKGGRLAAACHPARVVTLLISDVPGDDPAVIASGPTIADPTTCADALAVIARYRMSVPDAVREMLESGRGESVKPRDPRLGPADIRMIASPMLALKAAAERAAALGCRTHILGDAIEGEAREVGRAMAGIARSVALHGEPFGAPCILLSGGETTVTIARDHGPLGHGGRNVEFLLGLADGLKGHAGIHALAGDTDGIDGAMPLAGAYLGPDTWERSLASGHTVAKALDTHDGHGFFGALGASIETGPTLTNVNDFRAVLVETAG